MLSSRWKTILRELSPPALRRLYFGLCTWRMFRGRYATWAEASRHARGYDEPAILDKVLAATLAVRAGRAAYERDSVLFATPECDPALLAALQHVALAQAGRLRVLDFGGALGSVYFQHRSFLPPLAELGWDVVEQAHYVAAGRAQVQHGPLRFFATIDEAEQAGPHDVVLASGVVHCLPDPHGFVAALVARRLPYLLLHNLPLHEAGPDYVTVQHVPPEIYRATYPVWFLNRAALAAHFARDYDLVREFPGSAVWWKGFGHFHTTSWLLRVKP